MLNDLAVPQLIHVDVLNLEAHPGRLHVHEHSTIDRNPPYATMRSAERAANDDPFPFNYGIQNGHLEIRECALDIVEDRPHTGTPNLPTWFRESSAKISAAAFMSPLLRASCSCWTKNRLALEASMLLSPVAAPPAVS